MKLGFIGLGRMGFNMVERLLRHNFDVIVYNRTAEKTRQIAKKGAVPSFSIENLINKLDDKKIIWIMLPAGKVTDDMIKKLLPLLNKNDIIIDGANDFYENAEKHAKLCKKFGIHFFDCGVSGGIWGLKNGYTLMVGGEKNQFRYIEPFCRALAPKDGYAYFGNAGAGHFVKSVHNIVEYIYLQGLGEGIELLSKFNQKIDLKKATRVWKPSSVVRSWLLDLTNEALKRPDFNKILPVNKSVTLNELKKTVKAVKGYAPAFGIATKIRQDKSNKFLLGKKVIAAVRREFGGHAVEKKKPK